MNEWRFIGQESMVALGKIASNCKFNNRCDIEQMGRFAF